MKRLYIAGLASLVISFVLTLQSVHSESQRALKKVEMGKSADLSIEGDYWALIIGINEYINLPADKQLEAAQPDASAVADMLQKKYGFAKDRIIPLYNKNATRSAILTALRTLAKTLSSKDNLFIYYAGHGEYEKEMEMGWWVPSDANIEDPSTFISNFDIRGYLKAIKARHIYTVADSCFSEALMGKTRSLGQLNENAIKELYNERSRWILTSGGLYPVPDKGKGNHSTFAYYFLKILDKNDDMYIMPQQILPDLQRLVSNETQQTPRSSPITGIGDEGGQFIFKNMTYAKKTMPEDLDDLKLKEEQKRFKEEKARLQEDMRRYKEELERELKEEARKMEEDRVAKEMEQKKRMDEERRRLEVEKLQLEDQKRKERKKKETVFVPPTF